MKFKFPMFILGSAIILLPYIALASPDLITWKGTYYNAIPNKTNISQEYCNEHTIGTFIHTVKDALNHPIITDRNIVLNFVTFNTQMVGGVYFMHGDVWAAGKSKNIEWRDHIYYHVYKLTETGITKGFWSTDECKGFYVGWVILANRHWHYFENTREW